MSMSKKDHVVYGWCMPFPVKNNNGVIIDLQDDKFLPMIEGHKEKEFTIIINSMYGEYTVFGLAVASSGYNEGGWDFVNLDFKSLDSKKVTKKFSEVFGFNPESNPELFIFSDYSD